MIFKHPHQFLHSRTVLFIFALQTHNLEAMGQKPQACIIHSSGYTPLSYSYFPSIGVLPWESVRLLDHGNYIFPNVMNEAKKRDVPCLGEVESLDRRAPVEHRKLEGESPNVLLPVLSSVIKREWLSSQPCVTLGGPTLPSPRLVPLPCMAPCSGVMELDREVV